MAKRQNGFFASVVKADGQDENLFSRGLEDILTKMGGEWNNWSLPYTRHRKSRTRRRVQRELDASTVRRLAEQLHWDRLPSRNGIFDKVLVDVSEVNVLRVDEIFYDAKMVPLFLAF